MHAFETDGLPRPTTPPPEPGDETDALRGLIAWAVLMLSIAVAAGWVLVNARAALVLIYLSGLLAVGLAPLVSHLERRPFPLGYRPSRAIVTLFVYLTGVMILVVALVLVVPTILTQARDFARYAPRALDQLQQWLLARGMLGRAVTVPELVSRVLDLPVRRRTQSSRPGRR